MTTDQTGFRKQNMQQYLKVNKEKMICNVNCAGKKNV